MRDMTNELCGHSRYAIQIDTTRGMITIECEKGSKCAIYHYRPIERLDVYYNGPIRDRKHIREALRRSWIELTEENFKRIEDAAKVVQELANIHFGDNAMKKTVDLLVRVEVREDMTPQEVADTVDTIINAGLGDASDTAELPEEEQIADPTDALDMNIHSPRVMEPLLEGLCETERGNTLLMSDDGNMVAWIDLGDNRRLQITFEPGNYPALNVGALSLTDEELVKHIRSKCGDWHARNLNVPGVELDNGQVVGAPNYDDMTTDDEHRILSEIMSGMPAEEILAIGGVGSILQEQLKNYVLTITADTGQTFDDVLLEVVRKMNPGGILNHGDLLSELREHFKNELRDRFKNEILEKWEEEQSKT